MKCHEVDYVVHGNDLQFVEISLDPGETVIAEAGSMFYMEPDIHYEAKMGDGSEPDQGFFGKLMGAGKRLLTGESLFITHFTHQGSGKAHVAFASPYPGRIVPVDMSEYGTVICQKDAFLCAALGTTVSIDFAEKLGAGFFGGEGFVLQRIEGDGMAFLHAGGTIIKKTLNNEKLLIDTGCVVAFTEDFDYEIERAGNLKSMLFGGEGLFMTTLEGTGDVWLQSLPFSRLAERVFRSAPQGGGQQTGEGSILGGIADFMES
jgi:uncharacterized protein (TIGR00266 family)